MLLQKLNEFGFRVDASAASEGKSLPKMYNYLAVEYFVDLDSSGNFTGYTKTSDGNGRGVKRPAPYLRRQGSNTKPQLLADKAEFVFGLTDADKDRAKNRKRDFLSLVEACARFTDLSAVSAVLNFLKQKEIPEPPSDAKPSTVFTFRVGNVLPIDQQEVQRFWALASPFLSQKGVKELSADSILANIEPAPATSREDWQCIICSELKPPARTHPIAIKLPRSVSDQLCSIVSGNRDAFLSYGLTQSLIAPTCRDCAERYGKAANTLISGENSHITIGPLVYIFWTKEDSGFSFASILSKPEPEDVKVLLQSAFSGRMVATGTDETPFYATAFSASGSRVAVRDWLETTVSKAKQNLAQWFKLQKIVDVYTGAEGLPFPLKGYLGKDNKWVGGLIDDLAPVVKKRRDIESLSANVPKVLLHFAL